MTEILKLDDLDPIETREWIESIDSVLKTQGAARAHYLLEQLIDYTRRSGAYLPFRPNTAYVNTISPGQEPSYPGNREMEKRKIPGALILFADEGHGASKRSNIVLQIGHTIAFFEKHLLGR